MFQFCDLVGSFQLTFFGDVWLNHLRSFVHWTARADRHAPAPQGDGITCHGGGGGGGSTIHYFHHLLLLHDSSYYNHDDACYSWYSCYCYCKLRCDPLLLIILTRSHPCPKHVRMVDQATTCERVLQCPAGDSPLPLNMPILGQDYGPDTKPASRLVSVKHWGRDY